MAKKRQATSGPHLSTTTNNLDLDVDKGEVTDGMLPLDDDLSEPTIGEELAGLSLQDENKFRSDEEQDSSVPTKSPSADSVLVVLLTQALNADDRTLLIECLYTQDDKVITKSIAQLNPSNVPKLLHSLISITDSRGAILKCALLWIKCILLQHASGIMSQEHSLYTLNSLYQVMDEEVDEGQVLPVIYEDKEEEFDDISDTEERGDVMS